MKYLILIAVVLVVGWLTLGRRNRLPKGGKADAPADAAQSKANNPKSNSESNKNSGPQTMLSCTHCGLHLPQTDAVFDTEGRVFCGAAHRLAGPR